MTLLFPRLQNWSYLSDHNPWLSGGDIGRALCVKLPLSINHPIIQLFSWLYITDPTSLIRIGVPSDLVDLGWSSTFFLAAMLVEAMYTCVALAGGPGFFFESMDFVLYNHRRCSTWLPERPVSYSSLSLSLSLSLSVCVCVCVCVCFLFFCKKGNLLRIKYCHWLNKLWKKKARKTWLRLDLIAKCANSCATFF